MGGSLSADNLNPISENKGFYISDVNKSYEIRYKIPRYQILEDHESGYGYKKLFFKNSSNTDGLNQEKIPSHSTYFAVHSGHKYSAELNIIKSDTIKNIKMRTSDQSKYISKELINSNVNYDENSNVNYDEILSDSSRPISVSEPIIFRDLTLVQVTIRPFHYIKQKDELLIIKDASINLVETSEHEYSPVPSLRSRAFEPIYKSIVSNYHLLERNSIDYQRPSILYVLPSNIGNMFSIVESLMNWKKRIGYEVNYVSSSNIVNNQNNLKNYIQTAYETWANPPEYVTIVGDAEGNYDIPTWRENWTEYNGEGDNPYSLLAGNDQYPEVFLGRISFDTQSDLQTQIGKIMMYESTPYMGENWFQRACLTGDPTTSGISCIITNEYINEIMNIAGFNDVNTIYSGSFSNQMVSGISEGVSFFNYRGFWGVSGFDSDNLNQTTNGFMLPVATVITCGTGSFASEESLSEAFTRAGTVSNPKGAVACIGTATIGTHTMFNNIVDMGFYYGVLMQEIETAGAALAYGKLMLHRNYPSNPNNFPKIFSHWNTLIGDASLQMWTEYPKMISGEHEYALPLGSNYIDIFIRTTEGGVDSVWVTLLKENEILESVYTNHQGLARFDLPNMSVGEVLVTGTKRNHYPYQSSFQIYDPGSSVHINNNLIIIDDDSIGYSIGNDDGKANPGETLELVIGLKNYGSLNSVNVNGQIGTDSNLITILNGQVDYGDLMPGESTSPETPYVISLMHGLAEGTDLGLYLLLSDSAGNTTKSLIDLEISGSLITPFKVNIIGSENNILTPGMTFEAEIVLRNLGTTESGALFGSISSTSPFIDIIDGSGEWGIIPAGGMISNNDNSFTIAALEETIPGTIASLYVNIESEFGYQVNSNIEMQIGIPSVTDPVGPDSYGYYIFDSGDAEYVLSPNYNWVEIDDRYGGEGQYLYSLADLGDNGDDVETISLPFEFKMYGVVYNEISICSNGWISMGQTDLESFRNYRIPGVGGPSPMVAAFWDDLKLTNGGRVYTWYDELNSKFYIQWSRVRTFQNNSQENFQIILCDPGYYLTPTGDGEIIIQYENFNNTSFGEYNSNQIHGDYCTVGIEDHTSMVGLEYTFNNTYHPSAMALGDQTALLITTRGSDIRMEGDLNIDNNRDVFDILLLIDEVLGYSDSVNPYQADINEDGIVNIMDMIGLIQQVMSW